MSTTGGAPDAWDDDWVNAADKRAPPAAVTPAAPPVKLTKAERRAQHADQQRKLWDGADNPGRNLWLEAQGAVPNRQELRPQVTLLSRKPPQIAKKTATTTTTAAAANGVAGLTVEDDDEDDSEEEARKRHAADMADRQRRAKQEHEEKQRRYAEARERIMGPSSASSKPTTSSSPASHSRESSHGRDPRRARAKQGGGGVGGSHRRSQPETPAEQSPARSNAADRKQLFDPDDMSRRLAPRRELSDTPKEDAPIRQPRGPDGAGRGGFGFAARGGSSVA